MLFLSDNWLLDAAAVESEHFLRCVVLRCRRRESSTSLRHSNIRAADTKRHLGWATHTCKLLSDVLHLRDLLRLMEVAWAYQLSSIPLLGIRRFPSLAKCGGPLQRGVQRSGLGARMTSCTLLENGRRRCRAGCAVSIAPARDSWVAHRAHEVLLTQVGGVDHPTVCGEGSSDCATTWGILRGDVALSNF